MSANENGKKGRMIGDSEVMQKLKKKIESRAAFDFPVLITGESGVGKDLVAQALHNKSPRKNKTFTAKNCGAFPETLIENELFGHEKGAFTGAAEKRLGAFELTTGGTLFLDEVTEMPRDIQTKFLRVLEGKGFQRVGGTKTIQTDVRVIAATNANLETYVKDQKFRSDLFFRLNVLPIDVPPLRERAEDIPLLLEHIREQFNEESDEKIESITPEAITYLQRQPWPGNVRQLQNVFRAAAISILESHNVLGKEDFPDEAELTSLMSHNEAYDAIPTASQNRQGDSSTPETETETQTPHFKDVCQSVQKALGHYNQTHEVLKPYLKKADEKTYKHMSVYVFHNFREDPRCPFLKPFEKTTLKQMVDIMELSLNTYNTYQGKWRKQGLSEVLTPVLENVRKRLETVAYASVSSTKEIQAQCEALKKYSGETGVEIIKSPTEKIPDSLLRRILDRQMSRLVITDRCCLVANDTDILFRLCEMMGIEVTIIENE